MIFLLLEKEEIWRFWTSRNRKKLPADLDDIAVVSYILKLNQVPFEDNTSLILKNRNQENLFFTWLIQEEDKRNVTWWIDKIYKIFEAAKIGIDDVVNVNVLIYLGLESQSNAPKDWLKNSWPVNAGRKSNFKKG